ncbi:pNRC100 replication protein H-like (plasmid) [Haloarcula marismortui ATCC 43049]|uniref:PNRC100 replication protein H-like n=1 Tax=Haloarcula marismortui (strain ATCC 43049 / DSM 3752 / JCM 8966 / VKM B-1809) TaxID=272569 RepID=Q5V7W1_HALMA|nr:aminotransferase [Haloarcula marismortui]AAV44411.1 pNRC100 replication protein H-like [Haloarcula marismortui ATCC 43049]
MTFHVVGCSDCSALWIIDESRDSKACCPTCGRTHSREHLRSLASAADREVAAQRRSAILASRRDESDADLRAYWDQATDDPVIDDREYLDGMGLDDDLVDNLCGESSSTSTTSDSSTTRPDSGPDVDVDVANKPQLRGSAYPDAAEEPGIALLDLRGQLSITGLTYHDVAPQSSEWLGDLLADLIPMTARCVQDLAVLHEEGPDPSDPRQTNYEVPRFVQEVLAGEVAGLEAADASVGAIEEARAYLDAAARYALLWDNECYRAQRGFKGTEQFERIQRTLTTTGTSRGPFNAGVDALRHSLVALHAERETPLPVTFVLDGEAWTAADRETVKRALRVLDVLADALDVRLQMSPGVRQRVRRLTLRALDADDEADIPAWAERFSFLTEAGYSSRRGGDVDEDSDEGQLDEEAWGWVDTNRSQTGPLTVLAHLDTDGERSVRAIKRDDAIAYADGSIDRYVSFLEAEDIITVDRSHASNQVSLTALGEAAQQYVDREGNPVHPSQSRLSGASYGHPSRSRKCSVSAQKRDRYPPAERWLAATGSASESGYVQWLGDRTGSREVEPPVLHRRFSAAKRVDGVTFADGDILDWTDDDDAPDGDGRVSYISTFDDEALVILQWGGPVVTLGRLCGALFSNRMLSKALNTDALGKQWNRAHDGVETFENDLHDVLIQAKQIGWLSSDELEDLDNWRERIGAVRSMLLSQVGDFDDLDSGLQAQLMRDLHGLLCSAMNVYDAAGLDVTINIRLPDPDALRRNENQYEKFLDFARYTITKQAGYRDDYGVHSWYRMCIEDRPQKLRARSEYDIDDTDPVADLLASWVFTGPGVSDLLPDVQEAVDEEATRLRERVDAGVEDAAILDIPMVEANSHGHIRGLVREIADRKGFYDGNRADLDRLTRCLEAALAAADRGPDPCLVADALDSLESRDSVSDRLDVDAVEAALATLPSEAIFPTLPPAARRMLSALFASTEPLDRQDLIEITSESSYNRHHKTLRAFFLVEDTGEGFVAHLEPWWSSTSSVSEPYHEDTPYPGSPAGHPSHILLGPVYDSGLLDIPPDEYAELGYLDYKELLDELGLSRWRPILEAFCSDCHEATTTSHAVDSELSYSDHSGVRIGPPSVTYDTAQVSITQTVADD